MSDNLSSLAVARFVREHVAAARIAYTVNSVQGLAEAIEAGLGIGYLPCFVADARPSLLRLGSSTPALGNDLWFLIHPDMRRSARVRAFVDFVTAELIRQRPLIEAAVSVSA